MRIFTLLIIFLSGCHHFDSSQQPTTLKNTPLVVFIYGFNGSAKGGLWTLQQNTQLIRQDMNITRMYWDDTYLDPPGLIENGKLFNQLKPNQKIILIGHSFGGDKAVEIARKYKEKNIKVTQLILLDPVPRHCFNFLEYNIPDNVENSVCIYRKAIIPPYSSNIINAPPYENVRIRLTNHSLGISTHPDRQDIVLSRIIIH